MLETRGPLCQPWARACVLRTSLTQSQRGLCRDGEGPPNPGVHDRFPAPRRSVLRLWPASGPHAQHPRASFKHSWIPAQASSTFLKVNKELLTFLNLTEGWGGSSQESVPPKRGQNNKGSSEARPPAGAAHTAAATPRPRPPPPGSPPGCPASSVLQPRLQLAPPPRLPPQRGSRPPGCSHRPGLPTVGGVWVGQAAAPEIGRSRSGSCHRLCLLGKREGLVHRPRGHVRPPSSPLLQPPPSTL